MSNEYKVYVGNLPDHIRFRDLKDLFYKYGKVVDVDLHHRRGATFAFVQFEDIRDAEDAVTERDGYPFEGFNIRVEFPHSSSRGRGGRPGGYRGSGGGRFGNRPKGHQLMVSGLPPTGSWQDLKDHFRHAGNVIYANVYHDGTGMVEFSRYEHMKRAVRELDDSKFRSHEGDTSYIRVKEARSSRFRSPSFCRYDFMC